ncbi:MAG: hypothetical protein QM696_07000 [Steroidobacteraceae bacterium]
MTAMRKHLGGFLLAGLLASMAPAALAAQGPAGAKPDISGYWYLKVDSRKIPRAQLRPAVTAAVAAQHAKDDAHAIRWCNLLGMPFLMDSGRPLNIRQGTREIFIEAQAPVALRHIYLERRSHINTDIFDPATNGDSYAYWDGDTLIVDTNGFSGTRGMTSIPGGGFRTEQSHLVERFRLLDGGSVLSVVSTWSDPAVFKVPHSYEYRYSRLPDTFEPPAKPTCNPYDEERAKFLESSTIATGGAAK